MSTGFHPELCFRLRFRSVACGLETVVLASDQPEEYDNEEHAPGAHASSTKLRMNPLRRAPFTVIEGVNPDDSIR
jgi:hypothetical protein